MFIKDCQLIFKNIRNKDSIFFSGERMTLFKSTFIQHITCQIIHTYLSEAYKETFYKNVSL